MNQYHSPIVRRQGGGIWQKVERSFLLTLVLLFVMLCVLTVSIPRRVEHSFLPFELKVWDHIPKHSINTPKGRGRVSTYIW